MAIADVEIFGGGIFGLSIAYSCASRGCAVRVIEKRRIGSGASGGQLGALTPHTPDAWNAKKQFQFESLAMAAAWWKQAAAVGGIQPAYRRTGRVQPIRSRDALALAERRGLAARRNWAGQADWKIVTASDGWMPKSETGCLITDTLSAAIHPRKAIACLAAAVRSLGGEIREGASSAGGADIQVHATGHEGLEELGRILGCEIGRGEKGQSALLEFDAAGQPQIYADSIHVVPHFDGTVAVGSTADGPCDGGPTVDDRLDDLISRARQACPAIRDAPVITRWAGIRPRARTRAPILGAFPGRPGHFIANGGFKIGFGLAPLVGESMADLIISGRDRIPQDFSPAAAAP